MTDDADRVPDYTLTPENNVGAVDAPGDDVPVPPDGWHNIEFPSDEELAQFDGPETATPETETTEESSS